MPDYTVSLPRTLRRLETLQPYKFEIQFLTAVNALSRQEVTPAPEGVFQNNSLTFRLLYRRNPVGGPNGRYGVAALIKTTETKNDFFFNPLNAELNPICHLLALLGVHHFLHVSRIRVKLLTLRLLMSFIYGAPILDVSRSHTTTHHSR